MHERRLTQKALVSMWLLCGGGCTLSGLDHLSGGATETNVFRADGGMDGGEADGGDGDAPDGAVADAGTDAGATDAGSDGGADACVMAPTDHKRVFLTSQLFSGPLTSTVAADLRCRNIANALCLRGDWRAWLSDTTSSAATRFTHATVPYRTLDGAQIADDWTDLVDGSLDVAIRVDELGEVHTNPDEKVWTGTTTSGNVFPDRHCINWTSSDSLLYAKFGVPTSDDFNWTASHDIVCAAAARLYCFEQ